MQGVVCFSSTFEYEFFWVYAAVSAAYNERRVAVSWAVSVHCLPQCAAKHAHVIVVQSLASCTCTGSSQGVTQATPGCQANW